MKEISVAGTIVLFSSLSLILIMVAYELKKSLRIPVSPSLIVIGLVFRFVCTAIPEIIDLIDTVTPDLFLYGFLPGIIVHTAYFLEWSCFKSSLAKTVPMSTTVLLLSTVLTALFIKFVFYDFSWNEALLTGIILNITDMISVKSLLKDTHLLEKLEYLLRGESLLNGACASVVFQLILNITVNSPSATQITIQLFELTLGGLAMGIGFALVMGVILKRFVNDFLQETNMTIVTGYLLFWICNKNSMELSGFIAVIVMGLYMSAFGKTLISPVIIKKLNTVWNILFYNIECLIFIIYGMLLGKFFTDGGEVVTKTTVGYAFSVFFLLHLVRIVSLLVHYPFFKFFNQHINLKETTVMTIGGLKGVASCSLALTLYTHPSFSSYFRETLLFLTLFISNFSIIFDIMLMKFTVKWLKVNSISEVEENILLGVTTAILEETSEIINNLRNDKDFGLVNWKDVLDLAGPKSLLEEVMKKSVIGKNILMKHSNEPAEDLVRIYNKNLKIGENTYSSELRRRFYSILKGIYWRSYEKGQCYASTVLKLISCCNKSLENENKKMRDWEDHQVSIYDDQKSNYYKKFTDYPIIGKIFRRIVYTMIIEAYDVALTFVRAHYKAEDLMDAMEKDLEQDTYENIIDEAHSQIICCQDFIKEYITDSYPDIIAEVQTKMACFSLLNKQRKIVSKIHDQGVIKDLEFFHLFQSINSNLKQLTFMSKPEIPTLESILRQKFKKTSINEIKKVLPMIIEKHFKPETNLFTQECPVVGAYLIISGIVHESGELVNHDLIKGNIVGAIHLIPEFQDNHFTSAVTRNVVVAAFIPINVLTDFFLEDIYKESAKLYILLKKEKFGLKDALNSHIIKVVENSCVMHLYSGSPVNLRRGVLVLKGRVKKEKEIFSMIRPSKKIIESLDDAIVMIFPPHFGSVLKQHLYLSDAFASYFIKAPKPKVENKIIDVSGTFASKFKLNQLETTNDPED